MSSLLKPRQGGQKVIEVTPESAEWTYLDFAVVALGPGDRYLEASGRREVVVVPISGKGLVRVGKEAIDLARTGVFEELPHVLYVPPGDSIEVRADGNFTFTIGGAPRRRRPPVAVVRTFRDAGRVAGRRGVPTARSRTSSPLPCRPSVSSSTKAMRRGEPGRGGRPTATTVTPGRRTWRRSTTSACSLPPGSFCTATGGRTSTTTR